MHSRYSVNVGGLQCFEAIIVLRLTREAGASGKGGSQAELGNQSEDGATPFAPRCIKDQIEEGLCHPSLRVFGFFRAGSSRT